MNDIAFFYGSIAVFLVIYLAVWLEYKRSHCVYGGSSNGRDNWILRMLKQKMRSIAAREPREPKDICDY